MSGMKNYFITFTREGPIELLLKNIYVQESSQLTVITCLELDKGELNWEGLDFTCGYIGI